MTERKFSDQAVRFLFESAPVRGVWVQLHESYQAVLSGQTGTAVANLLLGESLAAAVLLTRNIKLQGRLAIQARGNGSLRLLVAESTQDAGVRGVIDLDDDAVVGQPLSQLLGEGYLAVTLLPDDGDSYQGIVPLQGARLQDCLADYFSQSEQLPTALWLVCDGERAAGLLLQAMPCSADEDMAGDTEDDGWGRLCHLAGTLTENELLNLPCEMLLHRLFYEETVRVFDAEPVRFSCTCSVERSRAALAMLGRDELQKLFAEQEKVAVDCQFCGSHYAYDAADMAELLGDVPGRLH